VVPFYHLTFIDGAGRMILGEDHDCPDQTVAVAKARDALRHENYAAAEIWVAGTPVGRVSQYTDRPSSRDERSSANA
jgi:hypothetical protein